MSVRPRRRNALAQSTMVMASNDTDDYGTEPPAGDYVEDRTTSLAHDTGSIGASSEHNSTDAHAS